MNQKHKLYRKYIKRALDILLSALVMVLLCWLYAILAILVRIYMGSPVIYKSERMGKDEKPFLCYKFRSMTNATDEKGVLLPGPQRLTKFGKALRSTSLDELPSIINILKGEMSIVGPRPLLMKYKPYYFEHERARHSVRPGLTGWAQVNGRNLASWDDRFKMDLEYVEKMSFLFDLKVLFLTVYKVIKRSDIALGQPSLYTVRAYMTEDKAKEDQQTTEPVLPEDREAKEECTRN